MEALLTKVFYEVAGLLVVAAAVGAVAVELRQPLIAAFIAVGLLVGPAGIGWVRSHDQIDLLATLGISLLLFVVGLKLDLRLIRSLGRVALATGLGQVLFTSLIGYGIALALGMDPIPAIYVAVALTFSSTIIIVIVKLLSDKRETVLRWRAAGRHAQYGDAEDPEFPATLPLARTRWVVSTLPNRDINLALMQALRANDYRGRFALTAHHGHNARVLEQHGADRVLNPFEAAAEQTVAILAAALRDEPVK